jgi:hypothetical protein
VVSCGLRRSPPTPTEGAWMRLYWRLPCSAPPRSSHTLKLSGPVLARAELAERLMRTGSLYQPIHRRTVRASTKLGRSDSIVVSP